MDQETDDDPTNSSGNRRRNVVSGADREEISIVLREWLYFTYDQIAEVFGVSKVMARHIYLSAKQKEAPRG